MKAFGGVHLNTLGGKLLAAYLPAVAFAMIVFFSILEYQNFQQLKQDLTTRLETFATH